MFTPFGHNVWKLDRLGRSLLDMVGRSETLKASNIGLKVLTGAGAAIDTTTPERQPFFGMFAVMAEFERELIRKMPSRCSAQRCSMANRRPLGLRRKRTPDRDRRR
jgi:DNA invertase Pin-like site-specific DNA recombinase